MVRSADTSPISGAGRPTTPLVRPGAARIDREAQATMGSRLRVGGPPSSMEEGGQYIHIVADDAPQRRSRLRGLVLAAATAVVFGGFGAVVWLAWQQAVGPGDEPRLVRASSRPIKEPPGTPGGLDVANEDSALVGVLGRGDGAARVERLLPRGQPGPMSVVEADPEAFAEPPPPAEVAEADRPTPTAPQDGMDAHAVVGDPPAATAGNSTTEVPADAGVAPDNAATEPGTTPPGETTAATATDAGVPPVATVEPVAAAAPPRHASLPPPPPSPIARSRLPAASPNPAVSAAGSPASVPGSAAEPPSVVTGSVRTGRAPDESASNTETAAAPAKAAEPSVGPGAGVSAARPTVLSPAFAPAGAAAGPVAQGAAVGAVRPSAPPSAGDAQLAALPPSAGRTSEGAWRIQVAAVGNRLAAESAWRTLRGRHPEILTSLPVNFHEIKMGEALLVRVQAGSFGDRDAAARACSALRAGGTDCFVVGATR